MMISKSFRLAIVLLFVCLSSLFPVAADSADTHIKSAGCKTEYYLMKDLSEAYQQKTGTKLRTAKTGNKKAVNLMLSDSVDFTFTCKPITKLSKKLKLDQEKVGGWKSLPIAKDPIVIVSNSKNGINNLSVEQLTGVFRGETVNWADIGGADLPINVTYLNPQLESGTSLLFKEFTVGSTGKLSPAAKVLDGPVMLGNYVSRTPGGVTFMSLTSFSEEFGDIIAIDGVLPSKQTIEDGSYRLSATYYLTLRGTDNQAIADFIDYCMSEEGQQVIARNFIPYAK